MKKRITAYLVAIVTVINLSSLGTILYMKYNRNTAPTPTVHSDTGFAAIREKLNLSPSQNEKFNLIRSDLRKSFDSVNAKVVILRKEMLAEVWETQQSDRQKIERILSEFSQLQLETQRAVINQFLRYKAILTPEQAEKFYRIISEKGPTQDGRPGFRRMIE